MSGFRRALMMRLMTPPAATKQVVVTYDIESAGSNAIAYRASYIASMSVDGADAISPTTTYNFLSAGRHTITFKLTNNYLYPQYPSVNLGSFYNVKSITSVEFSPDITECNQWLRACSNMASVNLENFTAFASASFQDCTSLQGVLDLKNAVTFQQSSFYNTGIDGVLLPKVQFLGGASWGGGAFANCSRLAYADIGPEWTSYDSHVFHNCTALQYVIIRATTPPTCTSTSGKLFGYEFKGHSIYVPDESVDAYKADANFADYVDKIKPLSEYTN